MQGFFISKIKVFGYHVVNILYAFMTIDKIKKPLV